MDQVLVGLLSRPGPGPDGRQGPQRGRGLLHPEHALLFVESTMYPFIGATPWGTRSPPSRLTPSVNLILPYAFPRFYKECDRSAVFRFSTTCLDKRPGQSWLALGDLLP